MRVFWKVLKWLGITVLVVVVGIVLYVAYNLIEVKIVTSPYKEYYPEISTEAVIAPYIRLEITNKYQLDFWCYDDYGFVYTSWFLKKPPFNSVKLYKTIGVIPTNALDISIEQRVTNDVKLRNNSVLWDVYQPIPFREGYRFICTIKCDKKIKILSSYMHGEILKEIKEETDKYRYRLIYANQRKLAFCEDEKDLTKGVLYFYFQRRGFINTDIAIVQMKNEPENLYFVFAFDEYAGKNHETIKKFMKDYFDIRVRD